MEERRIDVLEVIERQSTSGFQIRLMLWISIAMLVEGYDMQLIGYVAPAIVRDWQISKASFGWVFSLGMAGYMLGALVLSNLGDRLGRRPLIISGVFVFGACTAAAAYSGSLTSMTALRILAGIGLGGAIPNVVALAAEYAPSGQRATRVALAFAAYTIGAAAGGFIAAWLLPRYGWPSVFHVGGWAALLLGFALCAVLPESARFMAATGRSGRRLLATLQQLAPDLRLGPGTVFRAHEERRQSQSVAELFRGGLLGVTCLLWLAFICNMVALHFVTSWLPTIIEASGTTLSSAVIATGLFQGGGTIGSVVTGRLLDRRGVLPLALVFFLAVPIVAAIGTVAGSAALTMMLVSLAGICIPGGQCGINALASTLYPTAIRATGAGWALGIGRIGSIVGPGLGGILIALDLPYRTLFTLLAVPPLLTGCALAALARRRSSAAPALLGAAAAPPTLTP
jgi:AAHS family 4-hydroxybenzoate transporter-like MFS transporter